ncbi:MAG: transporter ATP-binding protein [Nocardioidaceae bacterium]|nr:transporter ATP-binding protein [Nocardioidaceae bacterium]
MQSLQARGLVYRRGDRAVLDGIDLVASRGQRIGLIGENGAGKSTMLRLLAGVDRPDAGSVDRPGDLVYLPQDPVFPPGMTVGGVLADALAPLHAAVDHLERLADALGDSPELAAPYAQALDWAQQHDAWGADRRAELTGQQLGLAAIDAQHPVDALSGGERSRLRLAALITRQPECVLLDEPTNHLDDDAMAKLEDFLVSTPGVVVAASHDRTFLDRVCTHLVDLDPPGLGTDGHGGRESTGTARQVAHNRAPRDNDKFSTPFKGAGVQRTVARRVRNVERRLDAAERAQVRKPREPLRLHAETVATSTAAGGVAVSVRHLRVPGRVALDALEVWR